MAANYAEINRVGSLEIRNTVVTSLKTSKNCLVKKNQITIEICMSDKKKALF